MPTVVRSHFHTAHLMYSGYSAVFLLGICAAGTIAFTPPARGQSTAPAKNAKKWVVVSDAPRVALVIGNSAYRYSSPLKNPVNDARAMKTTLEALGFQVVSCIDGDLEQMEKALDNFSDLVTPDTVALCYYSGHGMQVNGTNYLLPVSFNARTEGEVKFRAMPADILLSRMEAKKSPLNLVILDACRNNPFKGFSRDGASRGLNFMDAPSGTLIAYATAPGSTASDNGEGQNGLYTQELLRALRTPGLRVEDVFKVVRREVRQKSDGKQTPWESSSVEGDFFFMPRSGVATASVPPPTSVTPSIGKVRINPKDNAEMVWIPAGSFQMGDSDQSDNPRHTVTLSGYYIYKNLVTVAMYRKYCAATGKSMPTPAPAWGWKDDHPMVNVSWEDAKAYADWAGVRLPTEAQWEKAARGTDGRMYPWGDTFDTSMLWCSASSAGDAGLTAPVGSFPAGVSQYGVLDMAGNAWQWCADWYDENYLNSSPSANPTGPSFGKYHVLRGGSWLDINKFFFRSSFRGKLTPTNWLAVLYGFRCSSPGP